MEGLIYILCTHPPIVTGATPYITQVSDMSLPQKPKETQTHPDNQELEHTQHPAKNRNTISIFMFVARAHAIVKTRYPRLQAW
jgi:hypothetical protein